MTIKKTPRHIAAAIASLSLLIPLAACSNSEKDSTAPATTTTSSASQSATTGNDDDHDDKTEDHHAPTTASVEKLVFNGTDVAPRFTNITCTTDDDNGVDIDIRTDNPGEEIDIDFDANQALDGISVDLDNVDWESEDVQEQAAVVKINNNTYEVTGDVQVDDDDPNAGQTATLEAVVNCG